jgi:crossover junction endodeoxyribonuclease RuvC
MRILGIDPGSESTGYAIIESDGSRHAAVIYGAIKTRPRSPFHERLLKIHADLSEILSREPVDALAIEGIFYAANVQSALKLGHARGVALLAAAQHGIPVFEYSPLEIKSAIVGYGRAEKHQVQGMVRFLLQLPEIPTPDDAADALAVAICHSHRSSTPGRTGRRSRRR